MAENRSSFVQSENSPLAQCFHQTPHKTKAVSWSFRPKMKERLGKKGEPVLLWCGNRMFPTFFRSQLFPIPGSPFGPLRQARNRLPPSPVLLVSPATPIPTSPLCFPYKQKKWGREGKKVVLPLVGERGEGRRPYPGSRRREIDVSFSF